MTTNIRQLVRISPAQVTAGGGQEDIDYVLDRPPFTRLYWDGVQFVSGSTITADYVTLTATGSASAVPCELVGWYCSIAAGTITVYDGTSASGQLIVPATTLATGPVPIFGSGTNGKLNLTVGCWVVLSGAATVQMLLG